MSVFISYSTIDLEFTNKLSAELIKNRIPIWIDQFEIQPGNALSNKIYKALIDCEFMLVVLSENFIQSEWCQEELEYGLIREKNSEIEIIPIVIDDCDIPLSLRGRHFADFRQDFEKGFNSLIRPLSKLVLDRMGRKENNEIVTDYAQDWGIKNQQFHMTIDIINWHKKEKKSILLQLKITGCKNATKRYLQQVKHGRNWLMKESIINAMAMHDDFVNLNILVEKDNIYTHQIVMKDIKENIVFNISFRAVLMGEDTGNDILMNFINFLEMLQVSK